MKKLMMFLLMIVLTCQLILAANLNVEVLEKKNIVLTESEEPAHFTIRITNNENMTDNFEMFSIVGVTISPRDRFQIAGGNTRDFKITAQPHKETKRDFKGYYVFEYQIKGQKTGFYTDRLTIKIVDAKDAINLAVENIKVGDEQATIIFTNLEDFNFEDLTIEANSIFFDFSETFELSSKAEKKFNVPIKVDQIGKLSAGEYNVDVSISLNDIDSNKVTTLSYLEQGGLSVIEENSGLIIRKKTQIKTNEGNIQSIAKISDRKDVLSRLFTTYSIRPDSTARRGLFIEYLWERELSPDEQFKVSTTTNYTFPFIIILVIVILILIAKYAIRKPLIIQKRVSFVKTRGGEFALKVRLSLRSKKELRDLIISDRLPRITKLYEKFGAKPDHINHQTRQISWKIKYLGPGEERILTYIIYSKVNIIGNFELPEASVSFTKPDGKHDKVHSNRTTFAAESASEE